MSGWFAVKHGLLEHELFAPEGAYSKAEAWLWIVDHACHKPTTIDLDGAPYTVPRGALCYSLRFLAGKWRWGVKAVRVFLKKLEAHGAVTISTTSVRTKRGTGRTQITLCNYDKYQSGGHSKGTAGAQQGHKEEQVNNTSNEEAVKTASISSIEDAVWSVGKSFLSEHGVKNPGGNVGRWLKVATPSEVLSAINEAQKAGTQDPIPYITAVLKPKPKKIWEKTPSEITRERLGV